MDLKHSLGSEVHLVRACYNDDGVDLLAVAGDHFVQVLQCDSRSLKSVAVFHLGLQPTAIAWSPRATSPSVTDEWFLELAVATHDFGLHILVKTYNEDESIFRFGGGLTGHHGRIHDLSFVGGGDRSARHLASVSEDKNFIVWDLYPSGDTHGFQSPSPTSARGSPSSEQSEQKQPTALVIPFAHPLLSVSSHPASNKEFVVADSRGCVFLVDWRRDPNDLEEDVYGYHCLVELVHPRALGDAVSGLTRFGTAFASWRRDNVNLIGTVFGSNFGLWDISKLQGGKPYASGPTFPEGAHRFRWCPTYGDYFAISSASPAKKGASIHLYNAKYLHTQPNVITISNVPHRVRDFDWLALPGVPRLAVAFGKDVIVFPISVE